MEQHDPIYQWLHKQPQREDAKQAVMGFASFCGRNPSQIIEEYRIKNRDELAKTYGAQLFKYSQEMEKTLPPNMVRVMVQTVTSFFKFYRLPLKFGFQAHVQWLFK